MPRLTYIDLFAGCGGMSLGLEQAGFELLLAVEKSPMAAETYFHNLIQEISDPDIWTEFASEKASVLEQYKHKIIVKEISEVLKCKELLNELRKKSVDLVAGGPPCQGFSLAGRRNPDDVRNKLAWEFLEFVEAIEPKAVIIENVSGMNQNFRKHGKSSPFNDLTKALEEVSPGYKVQPVYLNAMHFGAPQHRPRLMLIAIRADIANSRQLRFNKELWKSDFDSPDKDNAIDRPHIAPRATHFGDDILTVSDAIADLDSNGYKAHANLTSFADEMRNSLHQVPRKSDENKTDTAPRNHVIRKHNRNTITRFRLYQFLRDSGIPTSILNTSKTSGPVTGLASESLSDLLNMVEYPAIAPDGTYLAGEPSELRSLIKELGTRKHSQRPLSWQKPSPTVVSLPDDYVHPEEARTLTVRECARFQTFPDWFEFRAKETTGGLRRRFEVPQYTQVGNAVPPMLARAVGGAIARELLEKPAAYENKTGKKKKHNAPQQALWSA